MDSPVLESFAAESRVVAVDLRGFGRTSPPPTSYAHHEDLRRVLDALDVDRAHFVGASTGAAVVVDRLATTVDDATVEVIADAAHLPSLECPDAFDTLLAAFLERVPAT